MGNRQVTGRYIASIFGISLERAHSILTEDLDKTLSPLGTHTSVS